MEKYLRNKRTMNECLKECCETDKEYHELIKSEKSITAYNLVLPKIIYTPKRSKEVTSLSKIELNEICGKINDKLDKKYPLNQNS